MTWEEAGLISKYEWINDLLRAAASRNVSVDGLRDLKEELENIEAEKEKKNSA